MTMRQSAFCILCLSCLLLTACSKSYEKLLEKQGYTVMKHPRKDMGTGTIFRIQDGRELFVTAPEECFREVLKKIHTNPIKLLDSKSETNLSIDVGAKYLPTSPVNLEGAFGYKKMSKLDVSFGPTTGNDLTIEGFAQALEGANVSKRCIGYLRDERNLVILGAPRVEAMTYVFHGEKDVKPEIKIDALKSILNANGVVEYKTTRDDTLTIADPMYIAYTAFHFIDLGIFVAEEQDAPIMLEKGKFRLDRASPGK